MFLRFLDHLEEWLIATLMAAATLLIFIAVVHRYAAAAHYPAALQPIQDWLLTINLSWAQELCIYMFIWMAKFGAAYGVRHGTHVGVDVLVRSLPPAQARWVTLLGLFGGAPGRHDGQTGTKPAALYAAATVSLPTRDSISLCTGMSAFFHSRISAAVGV